MLHGFKTIPELSIAIQVEGHMIDILLRVTSKGRIVTTTVNEAVDEYENKLTPLRNICVSFDNAAEAEELMTTLRSGQQYCFLKESPLGGTHQCLEESSPSSTHRQCGCYLSAVLTLLNEQE